MSIRFEKAFRAGIGTVRPELVGREQVLFDFLSAAGQLGYRLPDDDIKLRAAAGAKDPRRRLAREFPDLLEPNANVSRATFLAWSRASDRLAELVPGYMARFLFYTKPGDHIWPHPDDPQWAVTVLICIRHDVARGRGPRSAFLGYHLDGSVKRYEIPPGSALAVEPGLIHSREPVQDGERVALLSIGLCARL